MKVKKIKNVENNWLGITITLIFLSLMVFLLVCPVYGDNTKTGNGNPLSFDIEGAPDPFNPIIKPAIEKVGGNKYKKEKDITPLTPLELFGIEQLRLVGITMGQGKEVAMIEDPTGKFYPVGKGTLIGFNKGRVTRILANKVIVEEKEENAMGKAKINRVVLELYTESGGEKP